MKKKLPTPGKKVCVGRSFFSQFFLVDYSVVMGARAKLAVRTLYR